MRNKQGGVAVTILIGIAICIIGVIGYIIYNVIMTEFEEFYDEYDEALSETYETYDPYETQYTEEEYEEYLDQLQEYAASSAVADYSDEEQILYANNLITVTADTEYENYNDEVYEIAESIGATVSTTENLSAVGFYNFIFDEGKTYAELSALVDEINNYDSITLAAIHPIELAVD